ncbi:hypothetical protein [Photobacterium galatheae]|uniref:Uncharacterized protein n=1 Tax=Photobacterium galatheae TaxID=1654360 RepID=A0A066RQQ6_9GAMM|nr:hypothetical protein [Photobacterium galatheae]KDM91466.1 hypothetical protein EA58_10580 [Photobacterium galatheae]MCM0149538.1 hypothetical protein [Photobacterium galatheae]
MTISFLVLGGLIQATAVYVAFFTQFSGHLYVATILMVIALSSLMAIRSLIAPACLLAGVIVGLALSHHQTNINLLNAVGSVLNSVTQPDWNASQGGPLVSEEPLK